MALSRLQYRPLNNAMGNLISLGNLNTPVNRLSRRLDRYLAAIFLFLMSPWAHAAEELSWKTYLFSVMGIALIVASFLSFRNPKAESLMAKLLLAGLYFWVLTFAQLTVLALIYYIAK
ncbi:hypothetical protein [Aliikangiella coralliicola]|uniref:Uncharacterized protein n=1 Tax=Aliikangiella coralliicola TaxID=2592383 RepID=A0A545UE10_9GAMM|nr:hypothetical protein [Aliikangiella coralliicola]TQV87704.1 hypothetical protein FLL46_09975 [Aliikangiella coralliicola]